MDLKPKICCFTGHRDIPYFKRKVIAHRLDKTISELYECGYLYFGTGGALGFDTIAAQSVLKFRKKSSPY